MFDGGALAEVGLLWRRVNHRAFSFMPTAGEGSGWMAMDDVDAEAAVRVQSNALGGRTAEIRQRHGGETRRLGPSPAAKAPT